MTRDMKRGARFLSSLAVLLMFATFTAAQDDADHVPLTLGDFTISGSATGGFRFEDVKGYQPQFQEMFDLGKGFRLLDFSLYGEAKDGGNAFADSFSLQTTSLGGDPFPTVQFAVSKHKLYDLRVDWRQSYYYWNQNDNVILPIAAATTGVSKGLTSNHNWATVRKFGSVDFTLHATNNLRFRFNFYRPSDEGTTLTTRSLDFLGSPGYWGTYARANPYALYAPLNDYTNRYTGGLDYAVGGWSFHYSLGYQTFTENISLTPTMAAELSINPITSSTLEPLNTLSWSQFRKSTTPISEFSFLGKPLPKLEWRGGYIYYRYRGPVTFDQAITGIAPNATGVQTPYTLTQSARATVVEPNNIVSQGFTYHVMPWWDVDLDYRYSRFTSNSAGNFSSLFNGTTATAATTDVMWRDGLSDLTFSMAFKPWASLIIRPGVQFLKSDVESLTNGVADPAITLRTKTVSPVIRVGYEPSRVFNIRGDFHTTDNGASYTALTPHTQQAGRVVVRYRPTEKLSVEDEFTVANNRLLATDFRNNVRANAITVAYSVGERFSVFGGFSYESYYAQGAIQYARGTTPLAGVLRDQEVNRVWSGGLEAKATKRLGFRLSGNFDRSSGVGAISGTGGAVNNEPPAYGPSTFPLVTGSAFYDFPVVGRFGIDLQRTYFIEEIVPVNNFSANLLTIKWTKNF
jgi:hypothetical protein